MQRRALLGSLMLPSLAAAQEAPFPTRPPALVIPFPPGGIVDTAGRMLAERAARHLGQSIIIENRPGAGSAIGNLHVAQARPDGYTILSGGIGLATIPNFRPDLEPRDPRTALIPVAGTYTVPYILHINRNLPVRNLAEFVAWSRQRGPAMNTATSGAGSGTHLVGELFRRRAGLPPGETIHFRGGVQAYTEIGAGRADAMWSTALEAIQAMRAGQTRPIAVTAAARLSAMPDLPTVAESGFAGFVVASFAGWFVPAGTPPGPVARLAEALRVAVLDPDLRARFDEYGMQAEYQTGPELAAVLAAETMLWGNLIREAGIRAE
jgi:tripartite-type tricarboxylate transporter receptor subunit TctC